MYQAESLLLPAPPPLLVVVVICLGMRLVMSQNPSQVCCDVTRACVDICQEGPKSGGDSFQSDVLRVCLEAVHQVPAHCQVYLS